MIKKTLAVSSFGGLSKRTDDFIEMVTLAYEASVKEQEPRLDARTPKKLSRSFRHRYKSDIQFAVNMGTAQMMLKTGRPASVCRGRMSARIR